MDLSTLYGNNVPDAITKKAEKRFQKYAKKFNYKKDFFPQLKAYNFGSGFSDFNIKTVLDQKLNPDLARDITNDKSLMIGTIRMGFGHCRIAIALASAAQSLDYTPYWMDLLSFPDTAGSQAIKHVEKFYNIGSRLSQCSKLFNKYIWDYFTSDAGRRLTFTVQERSLARIYAPLFTTLQKDIPFLSTHPWVGHGAVASGMNRVITVVPDNYPLAFHVVPGSIHAVQSPSAYMGYRAFLSMGTTMKLDHCLPQDAIFECGHFVDHEIVANIEADCENRLRRIKNKENRRFLLTMGGAGAQVQRFADILHHTNSAIEQQKVSYFINMGDHKGRWAELKKILDQRAINYTLHTDWQKTRLFIKEHETKRVSGIHIFLHDSFYAAVYTTNLLMRISDLMVTKPSELSFYPIPKLFIQRVGKHEAWGAIRGSEIGDGTIETATLTGLYRSLNLLIYENDLLEMYCKHIVQNKKCGIYDGAYNAVKKAINFL
ncbi:MAG: DUF6938 domain-containing protein [Treponemataceae bacterium]